jgi:hypothetical protein
VLRNLVHDCTLGNSRLVHTVPSNKGDGTVTLLEWTISSNIGEMLHIALERQDLLVKRVVEAVIALCECGCPEGVTTTMLVIVVQEPCDDALLLATECRLTNSHNERIKLPSHDLQQAVYSLILKPKRSQIHLCIGH